MQRYIIILIVLYLNIPAWLQTNLPVCITAQPLSNLYDCEMTGDTHLSVTQADSVMLSAKYIAADSLELCISNESPDTIFVFESYMTSYNSVSKYLYRVDKGQLVICLVPMNPYLSVMPGCLVNITDEGVIIRGRNSYSFYSIPPRHSAKIPIRVRDVSLMKEGFRYFDTYNRVPAKKRKFKPVKLLQQQKIFVEIAYYRQIATYYRDGDFSSFPKDFPEKANDYQILRCVVDLE